jgi:NADPH2:quinone reductase
VKAAVLHEHGAGPVYGEFEDPSPAQGQVVVEVEAAGLNHVDLLKASGRFYAGPPPLPSVVGSDGVGRLADGRRVFFDTVTAPYGSMAERALVPEDALFDVAEGVETAVAAALGNSGLAAWLALEWRAKLQPGETVLVLGATGAVGSAAVQIAKHLGAGRVIAAARRAGDGVVAVDALADAAGDGVDVIIDPVWGPPAVAAMRVARHGARHVQLGHIAGETIELPAPVVRSAALNLIGMAAFHAPLDVRRDAYLRLTELAARGGIDVALDVIPLAGIAGAWERQASGPSAKLVIELADS